MDGRGPVVKPTPSCLDAGGGRAPAGRLMRWLRSSARYAAAGCVSKRPGHRLKSSGGGGDGGGVQAYRIARPSCRKATAESPSGWNSAPWTCSARTWPFSRDRGTRSGRRVSGEASWSCDVDRGIDPPVAGRREAGRDGRGRDSPGRRQAGAGGRTNLCFLSHSFPPILSGERGKRCCLSAMAPASDEVAGQDEGTTRCSTTAGRGKVSQGAGVHSTRWETDRHRCQCGAAIGPRSSANMGSHSDETGAWRARRKCPQRGPSTPPVRAPSTGGTYRGKPRRARRLSSKLWPRGDRVLALAKFAGFLSAATPSAPKSHETWNQWQRCVQPCTGSVSYFAKCEWAPMDVTRPRSD